VLKDEFEQFWRTCTPGPPNVLERLDDSSTEKPLETAPRVCKNTQETLGNTCSLYINTPITNAVGEGLNRIIKIVEKTEQAD